MPARSRDRPPGPSADRRRLCVRPASGLFWSMNCDELRGAEELLDRGHHGADVDQGLRRDRLDVLGGHALADDALHAGQAGADLVLDELADVAQATVAEVVDVVDLDADVDLLAVRAPFMVVSPACRATMYLIVATMSSIDSIEALSGGVDARASCSSCSGRPWRGRSAWR